MARSGAGNMLGVGGTRRNLGRTALRGDGRGGRIGGGADPAAQKRELLRRFQEKQETSDGESAAEQSSAEEKGSAEERS
ncbi:DUF6243 family protein [Streptomyces sp. AS02]|uniref:DUF6243 family protein n=1 Tax=Streptomyces sp. AS02 TaxID=2938946 RepID=UPI002020C236|nr:DUF6243 family protein [Streptomyces sp. AS02]MCL8010346.1 DUF6243 family protein [Streptomyces sp. AS02]